MRIAIAITGFAASVIFVGAARAEKLVAPLCVPKDPEASLYYARGAAVACWAKQGDCVQLGATESERLAVAHPALATPTAPQIKKKLICAGATCKPLGKKLAAAIAAQPAAVATTDARSIVLGGRELWDVARDRVVTVKPPKGYDKQASPSSITVLGAVLVATWIACAGPCIEATLIDANGAQRGEVYSGGSAYALDGDRIAIVPYQAKGMVSIVAAKTGKRIATVELSKQPVDGTAAVLGANELGVLWNQAGYTFTRITVAAGKIGVVDTQRVPTCL